MIELKTRACRCDRRFCCASLLRVAVMRQLLDVVHQTEELPLRIDLGLSSQREAVEPLVVADVAKHRLHSSEALAVARATLGRIDEISHPLGVTLGRARRLALEERHLPCLGFLRSAQAPIALTSRHAVALRSLESHHRVPVDDSTAVAV